MIKKRICRSAIAAGTHSVVRQASTGRHPLNSDIRYATATARCSGSIHTTQRERRPVANGSLYMLGHDERVGVGILGIS